MTAPDLPYLCPQGFLHGSAARDAVARGNALPLAGLPQAFTALEVIRRDDARRGYGAVSPVSALIGRSVEDRVRNTLCAARAAWAGLTLDRPRIMGVINVTPDSFSDGGEVADAPAAIARGRAMIAAGVDILDIGGESTRPGAAALPADEEARRVVPVLRALSGAGAVLSIDTRHADVMVAAVEAGATIINDVSALAGDPRSLAVAAESGAAVALMHMRGDPSTMQDDPTYDDACLDVFDYLAARIEACRAAGITDDRIVVDPGIGFGKTVAHNVELLARLGLLHGLGCGILLGVSRKSLVARLSRGEGPRDRLPGSLAAALAGLAQGVQIIRVHDVAETIQAVRVFQASLAGSASA